MLNNFGGILSVLVDMVWFFVPMLSYLVVVPQPFVGGVS
jgi:hypothetical protein